MEIKDIIRQYRIQNGLSQTELGQKIGTTKQAVQKYESGTVKNIPYDKIISMANVFGILPAQLLGFEVDYSLNEELAEIFTNLDEQHQIMLVEYARFLQSKT